MKRYNKERLIVLLFLCIPLIWNQTWVEAVCIAAIWFTFNHHQVASRMQEKEGERTAPSVDCHKKLNIYFYVKELLWVVVFVLSEAYSGIIGSVLFLLYPLYRKELLKIKHQNYDVYKPEDISKIQEKYGRNSRSPKH